MLLLRLALRNAQRNLTRSALTAATVLFGTALLTVAVAWMNGIFGQIINAGADTVGHVRVVDPDYALREETFPLYENLDDLEAKVAAAQALPGVVAAFPRLTVGVTLAKGEEIGDVFGLAVGAPPAFFRDRLHLQDSLVDGALHGEGKDDLVLGATLASRLGAKVGDEIVLLGQTHDGSLYSVIGRTVGVVAAGNALVDQAAFLPLGHIQFLTDLDGKATELLVYAEDPTYAPEVASALAADPKFQNLQVEAWSSREPWNGFLAITGVVQAVLFVTIVFVTALGIWNTMMMSVLERTGEIGVMRAMGLTRRGAVFLFVTEAVLIAAVGSAAGVSFGALGGTYLEIYGVELGEQVTQNMDASLPIQTTLYADMSPDVAVQALLLGFCMAVVGTALPALRAASIQPVEAMRARK